MAITDKKGASVAGSFKLLSALPLDLRTVVDDMTELQSIIDADAVYEGLEVYVKSIKTKLIYNGTQFVDMLEVKLNDIIEGDY